jgi:hypothetical protein
MRLGPRVAGDDDPVGLEVRDAVAVVMAQADGLAQKGEMVAGFLFEMAADGPVVVGDEEVGGLAPGAVERSFESAMERGRGQRSDGVGSGFQGDDDVARHWVRRGFDKSCEPTLACFAREDGALGSW